MSTEPPTDRPPEELPDVNVPPPNAPLGSAAYALELLDNRIKALEDSLIQMEARRRHIEAQKKYRKAQLDALLHARKQLAKGLGKDA